MKPIIEVHYRNVEKTPSIEGLIEEKVAKLQQVCADLISCRVSVERPQQHQRAGNPYRVRLDLKVPGREIVAVRESSKGDMHDSLAKVLRDAFTAARRRLREYMERIQGEVKVHPEREMQAVVVRLFPDEGYGFLKTLEGREIYFHRNSVLDGGFGRLAIGTGVRFQEEMGVKGPQAATVQIVDKSGATLSQADAAPVEAPAGWNQDFSS
jgi:cold shock CspA family protein/ribosome-associated translation inhibitor RaiA